MIMHTGFHYHANLVFYTWTHKRLNAQTHPFYDVRFPEFSSTQLKWSKRIVHFLPKTANKPLELLIAYDATPLEWQWGWKKENDGYIGWGILKTGLLTFDLIGEPETWQSRFQSRF